jgi:hypothetical protein
MINRHVGSPYLGKLEVFIRDREIVTCTCDSGVTYRTIFIYIRGERNGCEVGPLNTLDPKRTPLLLA